MQAPSLLPKGVWARLPWCGSSSLLHKNDSACPEALASWPAQPAHKSEGKRRYEMLWWSCFGLIQDWLVSLSSTFSCLIQHLNSGVLLKLCFEPRQINPLPWRRSNLGQSGCITAVSMVQATVCICKGGKMHDVLMKSFVLFVPKIVVTVRSGSKI
ncbi:hypothetical protein DUNSADRAFT_12868 [Dunaliella salina]|uniref:Encoded protein n=1 Tax=Dunaliella salina TaxID=3046 RepID=A0ABQ7H9S3_DUNSA|nr:hypothetical protein DUNSADRAFT_12868 [Dunaliella salina]|eukprot:KAF5843606.1 hypothetical protein DUNSADRAFT_12868 [Dunaliella salina]